MRRDEYILRSDAEADERRARHWVLLAAVVLSFFVGMVAGIFWR